jgi:hypothetical protein
VVSVDPHFANLQRPCAKDSGLAVEAQAAISHRIAVIDAAGFYRVNWSLNIKHRKNSGLTI